jgi:tetratricopeptide (TPR) repeat protein
VSLKKWLKDHTSKPSASEAISVDDLIIMQRYDEAEQILKGKLRRNSNDLPSRLKMAELQAKTHRAEQAVEGFILVAERYAADGFYDKAFALMSKAAKLAPADEKLPLKLQKLERTRQLERRLSAVLRALGKQEGQVGHSATTSYLELRRVWGELSVSHLIDRLDDDQLGHLLKGMSLERFGPNRVLADAGQSREELYLITRGGVEAVMTLPNGETTVLRGFEPGDVIGERALLERQPWPATYRTIDSSVMLMLDRKSLAEVLEGNPDPRGLLDALREQQLDRDVAAKVMKTHGT